MNKCLYCYQPINGEGDFHEACSQQFFGSKVPPELPYSIDQMSELAKDVVERSVTVPGVQPKLSMGLIEEAGKKTDKRLTVVGALGGNFIFKPPSADYPEMPANEHLTMRIAEAFGINVVPSSLIRLQSGELSYITKRVDRTEQGEKIHMLDMFQINEAFDKYKSSMEKVGKALGAYSANPLLDKLFLFELTLFSFLTGNNDMHLKNFSMILTNDTWKLAPAYDLLNVSIVLPEDTEELALTLGGKKKKLTKNYFDAYGQNLGLNKKQVEGVYKRFIKNKSLALKWIEQSFLCEEMKGKYKDVMEERYILFLV
ncbi:HipA domain-containing protein [Carboxylicivirga mesophila]|uniref:HipA domain-containing protein n=1 Tax=Carboxylicivirga mesophila TaxID=1166478 RepID=A0ABS5K4J8_9BACT|nr:HipA domain-containing protein [Carboxylicivirga mesophila]MBS2209939.1 HipA domain-containing protein [Carboxylicivirga mesophila]